jgi:hypothetical protein
MRKVTKLTTEAFRAHQPLRVGNTETDGWTYKLHGNTIAENDGPVMVSLRGWNTPTTRDRLNGIAHAYGYPLRFAQHQHKPVVYHTRNGACINIDSTGWYMLDDLITGLLGVAGEL